MLDTRQLHPTLAREVVGLSLWDKLDEVTVAELRTLYAQYGVLVFRRQALSESELASFCALFGELERTVRIRRAFAEPNERPRATDRVRSIH